MIIIKQNKARHICISGKNCSASKKLSRNSQAPRRWFLIVHVNPVAFEVLRSLPVCQSSRDTFNGMRGWVTLFLISLFFLKTSQRLIMQSHLPTFLASRSHSQLTYRTNADVYPFHFVNWWYLWCKVYLTTSYKETTIPTEGPARATRGPTPVNSPLTPPSLFHKKIWWVVGQKYVKHKWHWYGCWSGELLLPLWSIMHISKDKRRDRMWKYWPSNSKMSMMGIKPVHS